MRVEDVLVVLTTVKFLGASGTGGGGRRGRRGREREEEEREGGGKGWGREMGRGR